MPRVRSIREKDQGNVGQSSGRGERRRSCPQSIYPGASSASMEDQAAPNEIGESLADCSSKRTTSMLGTRKTLTGKVQTGKMRRNHGPQMAGETTRKMTQSVMERIVGKKGVAGTFF